MTTQKIKFVLIFFGIAILTAAGFGVLHVLAAPSSACTPNTPGCGAISTDASFNVSIGTSTPGGLARLLLVGSSTSANDKAFNIVNSAGTQILKAYNDGGVSFGTASDPGAGGISFSGNFSGLINASNISAGTFSSGAYTFASPSTLTVNGTTTASGYCIGSSCIAVWPSGGSGSGWTTSGTYVILATSTNNVGIGTTTPTYKLDVASAGATTARFGTAAADTVVIGGGSGKITVGTVDPVYTINGNKFATYGAEMTGVKGETTGDVNFAGTDFAAGQTYSYTLDLAGSAQGSDLWLFKETTQIVKDNLNGLVVILTPGFDGNAWYVKNPAAGTVTIFAKPATGSTALEASYRLTAPRFDAIHWSNVGATDAPAGIIIND